MENERGAPRRIATFAERSTWGECPACKAAHGTPCNPDVGFALGENINGERTREGAHLARLHLAPMYVQLVAAD